MLRPCLRCGPAPSSTLMQEPFLPQAPHTPLYLRFKPQHHNPSLSMHACTLTESPNSPSTRLARSRPHRKQQGRQGRAGQGRASSLRLEVDKKITLLFIFDGHSRISRVTFQSCQWLHDQVEARSEPETLWPLRMEPASPQLSLLPILCIIESVQHPLESFRLIILPNLAFAACSGCSASSAASDGPIAS